MRTYRRIVYEDRCQISALRKAGKTQAEIGEALGFSQGAVSRELARNADSGVTVFNKRSARRRSARSRAGASRAS